MADYGILLEYSQERMANSYFLVALALAPLLTLLSIKGHTDSRKFSRLLSIVILLSSSVATLVAFGNYMEWRGNLNLVSSAEMFRISPVKFIEMEVDGEKIIVRATTEMEPNDVTDTSLVFPGFSGNVTNLEFLSHTTQLAHEESSKHEGIFAILTILSFSALFAQILWSVVSAPPKKRE